MLRASTQYFIRIKCYYYVTTDYAAADRVVLDWRCMPVVYAFEKPSDLHQSIFPQGFYDVRPSLLPAAGKHDEQTPAAYMLEQPHNTSGFLTIPCPDLREDTWPQPAH